MRTTFDLPDDLMKRAKIAAVRRGSTLRDLVAEALRKLLADQGPPQRRRMDQAPIKLPPGQTIPVRSNAEIAQLFEQEDVAHLNDMSAGEASDATRSVNCAPQQGLVPISAWPVISNRMAPTGSDFFVVDIDQDIHDLSCSGVSLQARANRGGIRGPVGRNSSAHGAAIALQ